MHIIFFDPTQGFLSFLWRLGAWLALRRGIAQAAIPVSNWFDLAEALRRFKTFDSVQVWGHGSPARPLLDGRAPNAADLALLSAIVRPMVLAGGGRIPIWVWRSCAVFSGTMGRNYAAMCTATFGCRVAGFTYNIGWRWGWQSGMHVLAPGFSPDWLATEGCGKDGRPVWSRWRAPFTIWCLARGPI